MINRKFLSEDSFEKLKKSNSKVVVYHEFLGDFITSVSLAKFVEESNDSYALFESAEKHEKHGRYTCFGMDPICQFCAYGTAAKITSKVDNIITEVSGDISQRLQEFIDANIYVSDVDLPGFIGGFAGSFGYNCARYAENLNFPENSSDIPDVFFQSFRKTICLDHLNNKLVIAISLDTDDQNSTYGKAIDEIFRMHALLEEGSFSKGNPQGTPAHNGKLDFSLVQADIDDADFANRVGKAQEYIRKGDAFQIVLSRSFSVPVSKRPFEYYRALKLVCPAPYMFLIREKDFSLIGASPEKLLSVNGSHIKTDPIAGTRPRGEDIDDDKQERDLLQDEKEVSEHVMLVDLGRNDLGKIAKPGSVKVDVLKQVQKFSHVMHIVSTVSAEKLDSVSPVKALLSMIPAGTLSGAPKIRSMQIIDELENSPRKAYGGSVCMMNNSQDLTACIAIRMIELCQNTATVRAGAGVVFDSDPVKEAEETMHKARGVLEAVVSAEGGVL